MKSMIEWFARNSVAANLMMVFIVVSGVLAVFTVNEETFPEIELDRVNIEVPYLGAAPEEGRGRGQHPHRGGHSGH